MIVVDLHIVYIETVINMKLQLDSPISTAAATAEGNTLYKFSNFDLIFKNFENNNSGLFKFQNIHLKAL